MPSNSPAIGADDRRWRLKYAGNGYFKIQSANGSRLLGGQNACTTQGAQVLIWDDNGINDHLWRFV